MCVDNILVHLEICQSNLICQIINKIFRKYVLGCKIHQLVFSALDILLFSTKCKLDCTTNGQQLFSTSSPLVSSGIWLLASNNLILMIIKIDQLGFSTIGRLL